MAFPCKRVLHNLRMLFLNASMKPYLLPICMLIAVCCPSRGTCLQLGATDLQSIGRKAA